MIFSDLPEPIQLPVRPEMRRTNSMGSASFDLGEYGPPTADGCKVTVYSVFDNWVRYPFGAVSAAAKSRRTTRIVSRVTASELASATSSRTPLGGLQAQRRWKRSLRCNACSPLRSAICPTRPFVKLCGGPQ